MLVYCFIIILSSIFNAHQSKDPSHKIISKVILINSKNYSAAEKLLSTDFIDLSIRTVLPSLTFSIVIVFVYMYFTVNINSYYLNL